MRCRTIRRWCCCLSAPIGPNDEPNGRDTEGQVDARGRICGFIGRVHCAVDDAEADDAGADIEDIMKFMTHSDSATTKRYIRRTLERTKRVAEARIAFRERAKNEAS